MASDSPNRLLTARDLDILLVLDHCPLTVQQLLKVGETFQRPFTDEKRVRERMQILCDAGRVRRFAYATAGRGALNYYTLSPLGYRILNGPEAQPPTKRYFEPVAIAHQQHTRSLADFIVHTIVGAYRSAVTFTNFYRENSLRLQVGDEFLYPDCAFLLRTGDGMEFGFLVELDNRTERVYSHKDTDSWLRKIRLYNMLQDHCASRFRVLVATTGSAERLRHILATACALASNPHRRLFYGVRLSDYLQVGSCVAAPCFLDHRSEAVSLVQSRKAPKPTAEPGTALPLGTPAMLGRSREAAPVC